MKIDKISGQNMNNLTFELQLIAEYSALNDCYNNVCGLLEKERKKNRKLKNHHKSSINLLQQVNTSVLKKNSILTKGLHGINQLLIELYEEIDKNYTESLERNDKLSMNCAKSELDLITEILKEVEKI